MSAVQKSANNAKRREALADSVEEDSDVNSQDDFNEEDNVDDESEESEEEDLNGEIKDDTEPEDELDEYDYDVAAKVGAEQVETEPIDIAMLSEIENHEEETLLVSKDALNIHTTPYLTKYEFTKVIALRSQQILTGAPPTVPATYFPDKKYPIDPYTIALAELHQSRLPLIIGRRLPNNTIIRIPVHALLIPE
jgi:DNA-directed RNA polymerase subunit K/omega